MKHSHQILIEAREIISDRKRWTQFAYARDLNGHPVSAFDESAVCFDASAALMIASGMHIRDSAKDDYASAEAYLKKANSEFADGLCYFTSTNDGYIRIGLMDPHDAILEVYDRAIELSKLELA